MNKNDHSVLTSFAVKCIQNMMLPLFLILVVIYSYFLLSRKKYERFGKWKKTKKKIWLFIHFNILTSYDVYFNSMTMKIRNIDELNLTAIKWMKRKMILVSSDFNDRHSVSRSTHTQLVFDFERFTCLRKTRNIVSQMSSNLNGIKWNWHSHFRCIWEKKTKRDEKHKYIFF